MTVPTEPAYGVYPSLEAGNADAGAIYFDSASDDSTAQLFTMTSSEVDHDQATGGLADSDYPAYGTGGDGIAGGIDVLTKNTEGTITAQGEAENSTFATDTAEGGSVTINNIDIEGNTERRSDPVARRTPAGPQFPSCLTRQLAATSP